MWHKFFFHADPNSQNVFLHLCLFILKVSILVRSCHRLKSTNIFWSVGRSQENLYSLISNIKYVLRRNWQNLSSTYLVCVLESVIAFTGIYYTVFNFKYLQKTNYILEPFTFSVLASSKIPGIIEIAPVCCAVCLLAAGRGGGRYSEEKVRFMFG
jgi:hypothetical protein